MVTFYISTTIALFISETKYDNFMCARFSFNFFSLNSLGVKVLAKKQGRGSVKHKNPVSPPDMEKLGKYFMQPYIPENPRVGQSIDPSKLQYCVLFYCLYYLCRRGRENLYPMTKTTFAIIQEGDGTRLVLCIFSRCVLKNFSFSLHIFFLYLVLKRLQFRLHHT